jgi:hypothetical protein
MIKKCFFLELLVLTYYGDDRTVPGGGGRLDSVPGKAGAGICTWQGGGWTLYLAGRGLDSIPVPAGDWPLQYTWTGGGQDSLPGLEGGWTLYLGGRVAEWGSCS